MYDLRPVAEKIQKADAILMGASNGLSITEGLHLFADNQAFEDLFGDFKDKYGLRCLLHGMGARWPSEEVKWAFWSRLIHHYCGQYQPTQVMQDLKAIVGSRDYFILTSNGECHFERSGFESEKIYEIEGTWLTMQCARPCHDTLYPTLELTERMASAEQDGRIPSDLVPRCPRCGGPMEVHMAAGPNMVSDHGARQRFQKFLNQYHEKKLVVLELGIGWAQSAHQSSADAFGGSGAQRHLCYHQSGRDLHFRQHQTQGLWSGRSTERHSLLPPGGV